LRFEQFCRDRDFDAGGINHTRPGINHTRNSSASTTTGVNCDGSLCSEPRNAAAINSGSAAGINPGSPAGINSGSAASTNAGPAAGCSDQCGSLRSVDDAVRGRVVRLIEKSLRSLFLSLPGLDR
jgi:hypothetical protein